MMISENKENDRNSHKLDDDGGGVDNGVHSIGIICATESTIYLNVIMYFKVELNHNLGLQIFFTRPVIFGEHLVIVLVVIIGLFIVEVKSDLRDKD
ncbi:unnamed protein product [Rhizophagus irregularis]|uniref:Transmembrane protein n=1 Tax=Rhizophagus irregularis TaxID=588596 RepID=A0A916EG56_9GLOM|nr:unnamed protein product [Rhizophagus irregularis]